MPQQTATFATNPTQVKWSNGQIFDGYVLLIMAMPTGYSQPQIQGTLPGSIPTRIRLPIVDGTIDGSVTAYYTSTLNPPNCLYGAFWYDNQDTLLSSPADSSALFSITTSPVTLTVPTLTAPAASTTVPTP